MTQPRAWWSRIPAPLCGLAALGVYLWTLSRGAFPGESARLIAEHTGLTPFGTPASPLWDLAVALIGRLPFGDLAQRLNLFSACCAAAAVWLLAQLVNRFLYAMVEVSPANARRAELAATLGGAAAGLYLAFSVPFWMVANRAHTAPLGLLLLFVACALLESLWLRYRTLPAVALAVLCGVGVVETSAFFAAAPAIALVLLYVGWREERLRSVSFWTLLPLAVAAAFAMISMATWRYMQTDGWVLSKSPAAARIMAHIVIDNARELAGSLPQVGWLLVIVAGVVPFVTMLLVARRALNEERDWGYYILHLVLTGILAGVLFNAPYAPWRLTGLGVLKASPYALMAVTWGYLVAYWTLLSMAWWNDEATGWRRAVRQGGGVCLGGLGVIAVVVAPWLNLSITDARPAGAINAYARAAVQSLEGRTWLLTDGMLDYNLALACRDLDLPVRLLNLRYVENESYMRTIVRNFKNARLRSMAEVGGLPFLREWITTDPDISKTLAIMPLPDLWAAANRQAVPNKLVFFGYAANETYDIEPLWQKHVAFWKAPFLADLLRVQAEQGLLAPFAAQLLRHASMAANNLGVLLEDRGRDKDAWEAYRHAREICPDNLSALLNQYTLLRHGFQVPEADEVIADFEDAMNRVKEHYRIWAISRYYGYVRLPEAFADLGMTWALSGQPGMAVMGLKKAIELSPASQTDRLTASLANVYLSGGQVEEGETLYKDLLAHNPKNTGALLGLARVAIRRHRFPEATDYLKQAEKLGVPKERLALEYAVMEILAGQTDRARVTLQEVVDLSPELVPAWALLATVMIKQKDMTALREVERRLASFPTQDYVTLMVRGQIALARSDAPAARKLFDDALQQRSSSTEALEMLLQLDVREARPDLAELHVKRLLTLQPDSGFGNYMLGTLQVRRSELGLAESSFRKSLEKTRAFGPVNDLAWVLQERNELPEAEKLAREALAMNQDANAAWDTLGTLLLKQQRYTEAIDALTRAMRLNASDPLIQVHLADAYARHGDKEKAAKLAETLLASAAAQLSPKDRELLRAIRDRQVDASAR